MQLEISASIFAPGGLDRATIAGALNEAFGDVYALAPRAAEPVLTVFASFLLAAALIMPLCVQSRMAFGP